LTAFIFEANLGREAEPHRRATVPRPELLDPVLDPEQLLQKLERIKRDREARSEDLARLPRGQRLPPDHFQEVGEEIRGEADDPLRVARASGPPGGTGPPAPPPVIYLSRKPTVSQFMSVISDCVEQELASPPRERALQLGHLDTLWRDIERWTEDLRSRFRRFGPCDIRYLEPKLAQLFAGRPHAFSTHPPDVRLGENAKVFVVGDWATGLPQARNVAARIHEQLLKAPASTDCHVIHLGDTYYSGLEDECRRRFLDLWPVSPSSSARSWTLNGNHDMYAGGHGYFDVLLADPRFALQSGCSYFALTNDHWQILGLDSAYKDPDLADLMEPQSEWISEHLDRAAGRGTILLSHHQPFSAYEQVQTPLAATVAQAVGSERKVEAWLWGHEHRCTVYEPDIVTDEKYGDTANYTAIVGHGGVPRLVSPQTRAGVNQDAIKWEFADYYEVGDDKWGLGGFAVLTFQASKLEIQYYDEYGKERRSNAALGYRTESADVHHVMASADDRLPCPPDVIPIGADAREEQTRE
jgi:hypothetical protein